MPVGYKKDGSFSGKPFQKGHPSPKFWLGKKHNFETRKNKKMNDDQLKKEEKIKEEIKVLLEKGFFDLKSGQVLINKHNGVIQNIKITVTSYERGKGLDRPS